MPDAELVLELELELETELELELVLELAADSEVDDDELPQAASASGMNANVNVVRRARICVDCLPISLTSEKSYRLTVPGYAALAPVPPALFQGGGAEPPRVVVVPFVTLMVVRCWPGVHRAARRPQHGDTQGFG